MYDPLIKSDCTLPGEEVVVFLVRIHNALREVVLIIVSRAILVFTIIAVSYTHLDVYKRQSLQRNMRIRETRLYRTS